MLSWKPCLEFLQTPEEISSESLSYGEDFWGKSSDGLYFEPLIEHSLMPGDFLYYRDSGESDKNYSKVQIKNMHFKRRSPVQIQLNNGSQLTGKIKAKEGIILSKIGRIPVRSYLLTRPTVPRRCNRKIFP